MSYGGRERERERKIGLKGIVFMESMLTYVFVNTVRNVIVVPIILRKKRMKLRRARPWAQLRPR